MNANRNLIKENEEKPQTCRLVALVVICETSSMLMTTPSMSARKKKNEKFILGLDVAFLLRRATEAEHLEITWTKV